MENYNEEEFYDVTRSIQKDCHEFVELMLSALEKHRKVKGAKNQDLINIFFYKKLADIELRLRLLERKTTISYN